MENKIIWKNNHYIMIKGKKGSPFKINFKEKIGNGINTKYSVNHQLRKGFEFSSDGILTGSIDGSAGTLVVNEESSGVTKEHTFTYVTRKPMKGLVIAGLVVLAILIIIMLLWSSELNKIWADDSSDVSDNTSVKTSTLKSKDYESKKIMLKYTVKNIMDNTNLGKNYVLELFYDIGKYKENYYAYKYSGINIDPKLKNIFDGNIKLKDSNLHGKEKELLNLREKLKSDAHYHSIGIIQKEKMDESLFWNKVKSDSIYLEHKSNYEQINKLIRDVDNTFKSISDKNLDKYVGELTSLGTTFRTLLDGLKDFFGNLFSDKKSKVSKKQQTQLEKELEEKFNKLVLDRSKLEDLIDMNIEEIENTMESSRNKIIADINLKLTSENLKKLPKVVVESNVNGMVNKLVETGKLTSLTNILTTGVSISIGGILGTLVSNGVTSILPNLGTFLASKGFSTTLTTAIGGGGTAVAPGVGTAIGIVVGIGIGIGVDAIINHFQKGKIKSNLKESLEKMRDDLISKLENDLGEFINQYNDYETRDLEKNIKMIIKEENISIDEELNNYLKHMEAICEKTIINPIVSF